MFDEKTVFILSLRFVSSLQSLFRTWSALCTRCAICVFNQVCISVPTAFMSMFTSFRPPFSILMAITTVHSFPDSRSWFPVPHSPFPVPCSPFPVLVTAKLFTLPKFGNLRGSTSASLKIGEFSQSAKIWHVFETMGRTYFTQEPIPVLRYLMTDLLLLQTKLALASHTSPPSLCHE